MSKLVILCAFFYAVSAIEQSADPNKPTESHETKPSAFPISPYKPIATPYSSFPYQKAGFVDPYYGTNAYQYQQGHLGYPSYPGYTGYPYQHGIYNTPLARSAVGYPHVPGHIPSVYPPHVPATIPSATLKSTVGVHTPYTFSQQPYYPGFYDYNRPDEYKRSFDTTKA